MKLIKKLCIVLFVLCQCTTVFANNYTKSKVSTNIPIRYDLRDVNGIDYTTPIRSQGLYGTCYAFAANSAIESGALKKGIISKNTCLSTAGLVWYANYRNGSEDKFGNTIGDKSNFLNKSEFNNGGSALDALYTYGNWIGPFNETTWPYNIIDYDSSKQYSEQLTNIYDKSILHLENAYCIPIKNN